MSCPQRRKEMEVLVARGLMNEKHLEIPRDKIEKTNMADCVIYGDFGNHNHKMIAQSTRTK